MDFVFDQARKDAKEIGAGQIKNAIDPVTKGRYKPILDELVEPLIEEGIDPFVKKIPNPFGKS